jgi:hypothetical protein
VEVEGIGAVDHAAEVTEAEVTGAVGIDLPAVRATRG